jgi:3-hydroxybutyrate dehydrogenase
MKIKESRLKNKVAVITGAASGIGTQIARTFAAAGARVAIADLDDAGAKLVAAELNRDGLQAISVAVDVTSEPQVNRAMAAVVEMYGRVDILVSNAGIQGVAPLEELAFADWRRVIATHLDGAFLTTRAALRQMYPQGGAALSTWARFIRRKPRFSRRPMSPPNTGSSASPR